MTSCTDPLGLNEHKLFKELKASLPKLARDTRNILEVRDDILYVWHADKCCVLALNVGEVRGKKSEDVPYQTLQLTDPPIFEVTHLLINETISQLVLWGDLGIVVVELPKRWGKEAKFQGGKDVVSCLSHSLDACCGQLSTSEVRKVRWHPGSTTDSHLVVLTSDNIFQLYSCEVGDTPRLSRTWKVGPSQLSPAKLPSFSSLGDSAVDFDFATPTLKSDGVDPSNIDVDKTSWKQIEWPILVLRGNGEVLIVRGNVLINHNKPVVFGSLSVFPATVDNYGVDSCSIMCLQTTPPIVIIAACSGKLYHAIMLKENSEDDEKKSWSQYGSTYSLHTPEDALYVYECIEMELGLFYSDTDSKYNCPVHLHVDRENRFRYFCSHNAGIHLVNVPMVNQLDDYVDANDNNAELYLPGLIKNSSAQYLVSTRTKYTGKEDVTPILGLGLLQEPCILLALLHTGRVVDISVMDFRYYLPSRLEIGAAPAVSPSKKVVRESFDLRIKQMLQKETSQPITMIGLQQNLSSFEYLKLLYNATSIFRKQHFVRHDKVSSEFDKKVRTLRALKSHQLRELDNLAQLKKELQTKAENLAERYEDIKDKQEELVRRAEEVLRLVHLKEPNMNAIERAESEEIRKFSGKVTELSVRLEQLKKKKLANQKLIESTDKPTAGESEMVLKQSQLDTIKSNLTQMGTDIAELLARAKTLQEQVDL